MHSRMYRMEAARQAFMARVFGAWMTGLAAAWPAAIQAATNRRYGYSEDAEAGNHVEAKGEGTVASEPPLLQDRMRPEESRMFAGQQAEQTGLITKFRDDLRVAGKGIGSGGPGGYEPGAWAKHSIFI